MSTLYYPYTKQGFTVSGVLNPAIRHSAEKADGSASFRVEDGVFVAEVVLPFKKENA